MVRSTTVLKRPTILITGASSGLGAGMAEAFARKGHHLALCARRTEPLEALARQARPDQRMEVRALDVNDHEAVFATFAELDETLGGLDRIIVNAGVGDGRPLGHGAFTRNRLIAETNFIAALAQAEAALGLFAARSRGHLVLIASMSAVRGLPGTLAAYAASKAALAQLGEGLALEYATSPIRISTILPGYIRTPLNAHKERMLFEVDAAAGVRAIVHAIEGENRIAHVPYWPWAPLSWVMRWLPFPLLARATRTAPP